MTETFNNQSITDQVTAALSVAFPMFEEDKTLQNFIRADEEFKKMVENGIVKRRGYTLLTIEDSPFQTLHITGNFQQYSPSLSNV